MTSYSFARGSKGRYADKNNSEEMTRVAERIRQLSDKFDDMAQDIKRIISSIDWELRSREGVDQKASLARAAAII